MCLTDNHSGISMSSRSSSISFFFFAVFGAEQRLRDVSKVAKAYTVNDFYQTNRGKKEKSVHKGYCHGSVQRFSFSGHLHCLRPRPILVPVSFRTNECCYRGTRKLAIKHIYYKYCYLIQRHFETSFITTRWQYCLSLLISWCHDSLVLCALLKTNDGIKSDRSCNF